jgi:hypothetical protein
LGYDSPLRESQVDDKIERDEPRKEKEEEKKLQHSD